MLFTYGKPDQAEQAVLDKIAALRNQLRHQVVAEPRRWNGLLARMTRARALRASNSIEGINFKLPHYPASLLAQERLPKRGAD